MAVMFSDVGPDFRWVGNERGIAGEPCWATLNVGDGVPGSTQANSEPGRAARHGLDAGRSAMSPSGRAGSIMPPRTTRSRRPQQLLDIYYKSVGRGACLNLNLPPDRRGQIHENDVRSLRELRRILDDTFAQNLARQAKLIGRQLRGNDERFAGRERDRRDRHVLGHRRR